MRTTLCYLLALATSSAAAEPCNGTAYSVEMYAQADSLEDKPEAYIGCMRLEGFPLYLSLHRMHEEFDYLIRPLRYEGRGTFVAGVDGTYSFSLLAAIPPTYVYGFLPDTYIARRDVIEQPVENVVQSSHLRCEMSLQVNNSPVVSIAVASQYPTSNKLTPANRTDKQRRCGFDDHATGHTNLTAGNHELRFAIQCDSLSSFSRNAERPEMTFAAASTCPAPYRYWQEPHARPGEGVLWDVRVHQPPQLATAQEPSQ